MILVTFDFSGPALVTLDNHSGRHPVELHCRSKEHRLAWHQLLRLTDVRGDVLGRLPCARREAGESERCSHQLEKLAPADRIIPLGRIFREFPMQQFLKLFGLGQLFEAAPVLLT